MANLFTVPESLLAPGPEGPVASDEMEAYREGVQECEARIAIERALGDEARKARLGGRPGPPLRAVPRAAAHDDVAEP